jgi:hypothetical protein
VMNRHNVVKYHNNDRGVARSVDVSVGFSRYVNATTLEPIV